MWDFFFMRPYSISYTCTVAYLTSLGTSLNIIYKIDSSKLGVSSLQLKYTTRFMQTTGRTKLLYCALAHAHVRRQ